MSLTFFYLADFKHQPKKKKKLNLNGPQQIGLNESSALTDASSSAFISGGDESLAIDVSEEVDPEEALIEKLAAVFKTPVDLNWAW